MASESSRIRAAIAAPSRPRVRYHLTAVLLCLGLVTACSGRESVSEVDGGTPDTGTRGDVESDSAPVTEQAIPEHQRLVVAGGAASSSSYAAQLVLTVPFNSVPGTSETHESTAPPVPAAGEAP